MASTPSSSKSNQYITINTEHDESKFEAVYRRVKVLGQGKDGNVSLFYHTQNGVNYAVKEIEIGEHKPMKDILNEIQTLCRIDHPNLLKIFEVYIFSSKGVKIIMQSLDGFEELIDVVLREGTLSDEQALQIFKAATSALMHLHDKDIVHGDVKPENIMVNMTTGNVKLIDYGESFCLKDSTIDNGFRGTLQYTAPEILKGKSYTRACDIFSLGVTLFIMVMGFFPMKGGTDDEIIRSILNFKGLDPELKISPDVQRLLTISMNPDPLLRGTCSTILADSNMQIHYDVDLLNEYSLRMISAMLRYMKCCNIALSQYLNFVSTKIINLDIESQIGYLYGAVTQNGRRTRGDEVVQGLLNCLTRDEDIVYYYEQMNQYQLNNKHLSDVLFPFSFFSSIFIMSCNDILDDMCLSFYYLSRINMTNLGYNEFKSMISQQVLNHVN